MPRLVLKFTLLAPGAPLPDVVGIIFAPLLGESLDLLRFDGDSYGQLRSAFGIPDGTPGKLTIRDTFKNNGAQGTVFVKHRIDLSVQ
jgi:hypothetical protein